MSWHIIPMKFFNWNIICFGQKQSIKVQFFIILSAVMKVEGFTENLHHCSVKDSCIFLVETLYTLYKHFGHQKKFQTFEWLGESSPNPSCHIWNHKSVFPWTLHHSSMSWEITLSYFFSWIFIWFWQKEPIKVQNFRLVTAHMKFYQICTLIGSFCWNYI